MRLAVIMRVLWICLLVGGSPSPLAALNPSSNPDPAGDAATFPQLSPLATIQQTVGTTVITVTYHRPAVRGRAIWGALVPYGQVWRAGANESTTIRFSDPVKIQDHKIPAGTYSLFMIPQDGSWTVILNRRARQWGAFEYDPRQDVLRVEVMPRPSGYTEWLTYALDPTSDSTAYVQLFWEKLKVSLLVEVNTEAMVHARMKKLFAQRPGDWRVYSEAAEYGLQQKVPLGQALTWADQSIALQENCTNLAVKARLLHEAGQRVQAIGLMGKALGLAKSQKKTAAITAPLEKDLGDWKREG